MVDTGIILLAHGSRKEDSVKRMMEELISRASWFLAGDVYLTYAFLQFNQPDLSGAVERLAGLGAKKIRVLPLFLLPGCHLIHDIPSLIQDIAREFPGLDIVMGRHLGDMPYLAEAVVRWICEEAGCCGYEERDNTAHLSPREITEKSLRIIREHHLPGLPEGDASSILLRLAHASGDPLLVAGVRMSEEAVSKGVEALRLGASILVDVKMVEAGINKELAERLGCKIFCASRVKAAPYFQNRYMTKTAAGFAQLSSTCARYVAAIGNAPSALLALLDMSHNGAAPSLVIGMPVGFVNAAESKSALEKSGLDYITVRGTRGGSALAAATANSLLELANGY